MKKIYEAFSKLSPESVEDIKSVLALKKATEKSIVSKLLTISGVKAIIESLTPDEQALVHALYRTPEGITFTELERETRISSVVIEGLADNLSKKALLYLLKNRQLLNNKLDKIYGIQEFAEIIKPSDETVIIENLMNIREQILSGKTPSEKSVGLEEKKIAILRHISEAGFITTIEDLTERFGNCDAMLSSLAEEEYLSLHFSFTRGFRVYISICSKRSLQIFNSVFKDEKINVNNKFMFVNNLLFAVDTISGFGLFLTQQNEFRKIDIRRVIDSLVVLYNSSGKPAHEETVSSLTLTALSILNCLEIRRDAAAANLTSLKKDIDNPSKITSRILKRLELSGWSGNHFGIPFPAPENNAIDALHASAAANPGLPLRRLMSIVLISRICDSSFKFEESVAKGLDLKNSFKTALDLLTMLGIVNIENGKVICSEQHSVNYTLEKSAVHTQARGAKSIYINPDFSIIIPTSEVNPESLYLILSYVEIEKFDVIIHARITKASVVRAHKRGMPVKRFLEVLIKCSKNELPQNMEFLLTEWIHQIIEINITSRYLVKANHPAFIDELIYSKAGTGVIERISDTYIIIERDSIDDIIKFARKKEVMISLFKEGEDDKN